MKERSTDENWYRNKWKSRSMWWECEHIRKPECIVEQKKKTQEEEIKQQTRDGQEREGEKKAHTLSRTRS